MPTPSERPKRRPPRVAARLGPGRERRAYASSRTTDPPDLTRPSSRRGSCAPPLLRLLPPIRMLCGETITCRRRPRRPTRVLGRRVGLPLGRHRRRPPRFQPERLRPPATEHETTVMTATDMVAADSVAGGSLKAAPAPSFPTVVQAPPNLTAATAPLRPRLPLLKAKAQPSTPVERVPAPASFHTPKARERRRPLAAPASLTRRLSG